MVGQVGAQPDIPDPGAIQEGPVIDEENRIIKNLDHPIGEADIQPPKVIDNNGRDKEMDSMDDEEEGAYTTDQLQFMMGLSLTAGFVFMLLIDQCGGGHSHTHMPDSDVNGRHRRKNMTATIGLVVHAAGELKVCHDTRPQNISRLCTQWNLRIKGQISHFIHIFFSEI